MGKASRRKHERRAADPQRPRWAGAPGFDRSYKIAERYVNACNDIIAAKAQADLRAEAMAQLIVAKHVGDVAGRQVATLEEALRRAGVEPEPRTPPPPKNDPMMFPGRPDELAAHDFLPYAQSLAALAGDQLQQMREATPIVFDPLSVPGLTVDAVDGLGLPFPSVVADFLAPGGMSLPVQKMTDGAGWWVGLIAATVAQGEEAGPVDVWPTITTLEPERTDDDQTPKELMFGRVRFGAPLPPAPDGLRLVEGDGWAAWIVDIRGDDELIWTDLWVVKPALAAISALRVLDAVNVGLVDVALSRSQRRRALREDAEPALTVDITTGRSHAASGGTGHATIDWQQRWMVRGHWKHFGEGTAVARRHPSRVKDIPGHGRCVRVWCPPFVKGPADKPLVLKTRLVSNP